MQEGFLATLVLEVNVRKKREREEEAVSTVVYE